MRRIISVLAVMAAMVAASAMPAFAKGQPQCKGNANPVQVNQGSNGDANGNGTVCQAKKGFSFTDDRG